MCCQAKRHMRQEAKSKCLLRSIREYQSAETADLLFVLVGHCGMQLCLYLDYTHKVKLEY